MHKRTFNMFNVRFIVYISSEHPRVLDNVYTPTQYTFPVLKAL